MTDLATVFGDPQMDELLAESVCITVGVTAHRDLSALDQQSLRAEVRKFLSRLQNDNPDLPMKMLNPLAEGGDRLVAEVALELGVNLVVPLPMPAHEYEAEFADADSVAHFRSLIDLAKVVQLPPVDADGGLTLRDLRKRQYAQLGVFISSHSQILLALWDGLPSDKLGGTASVVHFHINDDMPGYLELQDTAHLLADNENDLVYHIVCPRETYDTSQTPLTGRWLTHSGYHDDKAVPDDYQSVFTNMIAFRHDIHRHRNSIAEVVGELPGSESPHRERDQRTIEWLLDCTDHLAVHYGTQVVSGLRTTYFAAVLMGLCFILYSEFSELSFLLPAFIVLFGLAYLHNRLAESREWHRKYLDYRALAEGLRVQRYWTMAGVEGPSNTAYAYDNILQKQDVELVWIRHVMRNALVHRERPLRRTDEDVEMAIKDWIGSEETGEGQLGYYQRKAAERALQFQRTNRLGTLCLWVGMSTAVALLLIGGGLSDFWFNILLAFMGILPLIAGVREAYAFKKADRELVKQYQFMAQTFARAQKKLADTSDSHARRKILYALGHACLEEHAEWLLMQRERPLEHSGLQT
ncbi:hypothetical protein [Marinobacter alexandrii]|uniref:hypothetical protein n=1 Tax=Marinobacter alexandrii TaxID=2570351 RepID=UPI003298D758